MLRITAYNFKAIVEGSFSLLPGGSRLFARGTRGSDSAPYCYSVWLRHLVKTRPFAASPLDGTVIELGPGDSLGMGLAALLSGASRYIAVDVVRHADVEQNLAVFAELVRLFAGRTPLPSGEEFSEVMPELDDYDFPEAILDAERMARNLAPERIAGIVAALRATPGEGEGSDLPVRYVDPAAAATVIPRGSANWVFSQAVLEHVDDLAGVYRACHRWLKPGDLMSHQIDFRSHGAAREWNGHWAYPDLVWSLLRGRRPYLLNRAPCGTHLDLLAAAGFEVLAVERARRPSRLRREQLAQRFRYIADDDLGTAGAFVVARKIGRPELERPDRCAV